MRYFVLELRKAPVSGALVNIEVDENTILCLTQKWHLLPSNKTKEPGTG
jgi:hypothetical protein